MRLPVDGRLAPFARICAALTMALALGACGSSERLPLASAPVNGPGADYPVVIGAPYSAAGVSYSPEDVLNYDEVGYLAADAASGDGISAAHHTLPLPSYVEVTSLETGRTILVRVERRGPMNGSEPLALSGAALAELRAAPGAPIRVRRVNPPEDHRALLRAGRPAPERMDTPMPLVEVLKRRLPSQGSAPLRSAQAAPQPQPVQAAAAPVRQQPPAAPPALPPLAVATPPPSSVPASFERAFAPPAAPTTGRFIVQAAAFSTSDRAEQAANVLGGDVSRSGRFYRVRTGPFATRGEAEASLAKVQAAGYRDARIFTNG